MTVIARDKNQITLYYSSENSIGKQVLGYVKSADKEILAIDISKTTVTPTQWSEIADGLSISIKDLIGTEHPDFKETYGANAQEMNDVDWLKILEKSPELLRCPIVINGEHFEKIETAADFKKYIEADSAGIEKPYNS